jgi:transcriptional regulator with PAS, ATPase and Fis domain
MRMDRTGKLLTADPTMQQILEAARNVANSRAPVMLVGESGTGKELIAQMIHDQSSRRKNRLVAINCAAVPEGLLESELFGFEKGAFTGAVHAKPGKFEAAQGSTLLLDEISEMPLILQAKLLRVLQTGEFERIGSNQPRFADVRIISTTNKDLEQLVAAGKFREDLYYRLNVIPMSIPPLRERPLDIRLIASTLVGRLSFENNRGALGLTDEAMNRLLAWHWPGNVRELENIVERAVLFAQGAVINAEDLKISDSHRIPKRNENLKAGMTISEAERALIMKTLEFTAQNRTHAARLLGISIRTLRNKLSEYKREAVL